MPHTLQLESACPFLYILHRIATLRHTSQKLLSTGPGGLHALSEIPPRYDRTPASHPLQHQGNVLAGLYLHRFSGSGSQSNCARLYDRHQCRSPHVLRTRHQWPRWTIHSCRNHPAGHDESPFVPCYVLLADGADEYSEASKLVVCLVTYLEC